MLSQYMQKLKFATCEWCSQLVNVS